MAIPLVDREFWKHPGVWKIPPIYPVKEETYLPTADFIAGAVNLGVNCVFFTFLYWESMTGIGRGNHFLWPFAISALIHSATIIDFSVFAGLSSVVRSDAGVRSYIRDMVTDKPSDWPHVSLVRSFARRTMASRMRDFAHKVRAVKLADE